MKRSSFLAIKGILCFLLFSLLAITELRATHIVGGEMGYTCLGNNQYEIRLTIYRDCFFGNPDAYFDDPASIGVFDSNNFLLQDIRVDLMGDDTLSPVLTNECLVIPPDVCVHTTTYRTVVELLPRAGGYQLAYQRCCRNQTIENIIDPLGTGATYGVTISEQALEGCNSSATFLQWPPLYICANEPILFDQSAIDIDGDSIVYRLCTPLQGANPDIPRPQPPNPPPYQEVVWNDPPYNVNNMLNGFSGDEPLQIDAQTGLLTGTPNTVGQFVVGICAEEYRNGELIATARRDFQYNVGICGQTTAAFSAPEIQCDDLDVAVSNQSEGTDNFFWIFGDPANPVATSTVENLSVTFPDYGIYDITLIAAFNETCADTFTQSIELLPLSLEPAFRLDTLSCGDSLVIQLIDLSTDSLSSITNWEWTLNGDIISTEQAPLISITETGNYEIGLTLFAENGCQNAVVTSLTGVNFIQESLPGDTLFLCPGDSVFLNPAFSSQYNYLWEPAVSLDEPTNANPLAFPTATTTYQLILTEPNSGCTAEREITVVVTPPLTVELSPNITTCEETITLTASSPTAVRYLWSPTIDFSSEVSDSTAYVVSPIGEQTYYLLLLDVAGCTLLDSVTVNSLAVNLEFAVTDTIICLGESLSLSAENIDPNDQLTYDWQPVASILSGANTASPVVLPAQAGIQFYTLITANQEGCDRMDSVRVTVVDPALFGVDVAFQQCSGRRVDFSSTDPAAAAYIWHFGDPTQPNASAEGASVSHEYGQAGTYQVMVSLPDYLACTDTTFVEIVVTEQGSVTPDFDWEYTACAETATIAVTDATTTNGTSLENWLWFLEGVQVSEESNFSFTVDSNSLVSLSLVTTADNGCIDTIQQVLEIPLISLDLVDSLLLCPNESIALNPSGSPSYSYLWSPGASLSDSTVVNPVANPAFTTTYEVTVSDPSSICERTMNIFVEVPPEPDYALSPDTALCDPTWQLFIESADDLAYIWSDAIDFNTVLGTESNLNIETVPQSTYYLQLTDSLGCSFTDSVQVDGRGVVLLVPPEQLVCRNDTITLEAMSANSYSISSYEWQPTEIIIGPSNTAEVTVAPLDNTILTLLATNEFGCQADTFVRLDLQNLLPPLSISPANDTLIPGESVQLIATEDDDYIYQWSPTISLSGTDIFDPFASPEETTTYQLTITDENGCTNSAQALIVVFNSPCQAPFIFVPNAFSPNGDLLNDILEVKANVIEEFYFAVYDRWGELVFESRNQNDSWDGTFEDRALTPDVYGYILEVGCFNGERYLDKGNVTLIR